jgi:hypothetical protein
MGYTSKLKARIKNNVLRISEEQKINIDEKKTAIIFRFLSDNFLNTTYENICKNPDWQKRTQKKHTHFEDTLEMQSPNSSDAILMNIFCHPQFTNWIGPHKLLGIDKDEEIIFGWNPSFENEKKANSTEIDMKIGHRIFESKLTESSFTEKNLSVVEKYSDFYDVFDQQYLIKESKKGNKIVKNYQLIRNILTAYKYDLHFSVLLDSSRIDLIKEIMTVIKSLKKEELKNRVDFFTWQEVANTCGVELKKYMENKYF